MTCGGCGNDIPPGTNAFRKVVGFKPMRGDSVKIVASEPGEYCRGCVEGMAASGKVWEQLSLFPA